jgi:membrane glycosyltransferase
VNAGVENRLTIAQSVSASVDWKDVILYNGFTMDVGIEKILLVKFQRADGWLNNDFTPAVPALIELAEVILDCDRLYACIDRNATEISCLVRSLLYVGFTVAKSPFSSHSAEKYLMLSYETE